MPKYKIGDVLLLDDKEDFPVRVKWYWPKEGGYWLYLVEDMNTNTLLWDIPERRLWRWEEMGG